MKIFMQRRVGITVLLKFICLTVQKKFLGEPLCFGNVPVWKKLWTQGGVSRFSVGNFSSHRAKKIRKGTHLCFKKNFAMTVSMQKRGGNHILSIFFVLKYQKFSLGDPCVSEMFWYGKFLIDEREGITFFRRNFFVSRYHLKNS